MSDTLLDYSLSTEPDPLQVSPPTVDPSLATLRILVSNSSDDLVNCKSIDFGFSVGENASDFSDDLSGVAVTSPPGWSVTQDGGDFTATPKTAAAGVIGRDGLTFTLSKMKVNKEPGTASLLITETAASPTAFPSQPEAPRTTSIALAKFPLAFKVSELKAKPPPPLKFGGSVTLSWVGTSGATYELRYEAADGSIVSVTHTKDGQPLPANGSYHIDDLEKETTFYLHVTLVVKGQDDPPKLERFVTVAVAQPKPQITSFTTGSTPRKLILRWETTNADSCAMSGDSHQLNPDSTDDSYSILWTDSPRDTYTLTARNSVGKVTKTITTRLALTNGMRVKDISDGGKIYLMIDGTLRLIPSDEAYNRLFKDRSNITDIPTANAYPLGQPLIVSLSNGITEQSYLTGEYHYDEIFEGTYYPAAFTGKYYLVVDSTQRYIPGAEVIARYNFNISAAGYYFPNLYNANGPDVP
jgi:hypothetical protein